VPAPEALHASVTALVERKRGRRRVLSVRAALPAAAVAVAAAILVFTLAGGPSDPSVERALTLGSAGPTAPAPRADAARRGALSAEVGGVAFPNWSRSMGWDAVGARSDRIAGRQVATVYYASRSGERVRYSIVDGKALGEPAVQAVYRSGVAFRVFKRGGEVAVVWRRGGRTCLLSGRNASATTLLRLASYEASEIGRGSAS
jgi:hypothetical protein